MLNIFKVAALAVTTSFASASAMAEVNLVSHTAGAGTAVGLTASALEVMLLSGELRISNLKMGKPELSICWPLRKVK